MSKLKDIGTIIGDEIGMPPRVIRLVLVIAGIGEWVVLLCWVSVLGAFCTDVVEILPVLQDRSVVGIDAFFWQ